MGLQSFVQTFMQQSEILRRQRQEQEEMARQAGRDAAAAAWQEWEKEQRKSELDLRRRAQDLAEREAARQAQEAADTNAFRQAQLALQGKELEQRQSAQFGEEYNRLLQQGMPQAAAYTAAFQAAYGRVPTESEMRDFARRMRTGEVPQMVGTVKPPPMPFLGQTLNQLVQRTEFGVPEPEEEAFARWATSPSPGFAWKQQMEAMKQERENLLAQGRLAKMFAEAEWKRIDANYIPQRAKIQSDLAAHRKRVEDIRLQIAKMNAMSARERVRIYGQRMADLKNFQTAEMADIHRKLKSTLSPVLDAAKDLQSMETKLEQEAAGARARETALRVMLEDPNLRPEDRVRLGKDWAQARDDAVGAAGALARLRENDVYKTIFGYSVGDRKFPGQLEELQALLNSTGMTKIETPPGQGKRPGRPTRSWRERSPESAGAARKRVLRFDPETNRFK